MLIECGVCKRQIFKKQSDLKKSKSGKLFCSRSCSAKYGNSIKKKRQLKEVICRACNLPIHRKTWRDKLTYHVECNPKNKNWDSVKVEDVLYPNKGKNKYGYLWVLSRKSFFDKSNIRSCQRCGYDKHFDVCHIKPVSSFSKDSLVSEVNHISNLIALCKNCHWEFDNGLLNLEEIK